MISTLSLHDALTILELDGRLVPVQYLPPHGTAVLVFRDVRDIAEQGFSNPFTAELRTHEQVFKKQLRPLPGAVEVKEKSRSEEHTSELQSPDHLVCRHDLHAFPTRRSYDLRARWPTCSSSVPPTAWHGSSRFSRCSRHSRARLFQSLYRGIEDARTGLQETTAAPARCCRSERKKQIGRAHV